MSVNKVTPGLEFITERRTRQGCDPGLAGLGCQQRTSEKGKHSSMEGDRGLGLGRGKGGREDVERVRLSSIIAMFCYINNKRAFPRDTCYLVCCYTSALPMFPGTYAQRVGCHFTRIG